MASRAVRSSRVLRASSSTRKAVPASRPIRLPKPYSVAPMAKTNSKPMVQRPGSGRARQASPARHSSTAKLAPLHHSGKKGSCGLMSQATSTTRNRVSRCARGITRRVAGS